MSIKDLIKEHAIHAAKHGDADAILALREYYPELGEVLMVVHAAMGARDAAEDGVEKCDNLAYELREQLQETTRRLTLLEEEVNGLKYE